MKKISRWIALIILIIGIGAISVDGDTVTVWPALEFKNTVLLNTDIDQFTEHVFFSELSQEYLGISSAGPDEYLAQKRRYFEKKFSTSLRRLAWDLIIQEEAYKRGWGVEEEVLDKEYEKALANAPIPYDAKWEAMTRGRLKEKIRKDFVSTAIKRILKDDLGAGYVSPKGMYDFYISAKAKYNSSVTHPPHSEMQIFLQPMRVKLNKMTLALRSLSAYQNSSNAQFPIRMGQAENIVHNVLSAEMIAQVISDFHHAIAFSKKHTSQKLQQFMDDQAEKYGASQDKVAYLLLQLYEIARMIQLSPTIDLTAIETQARAEITRVSQKARDILDRKDIFFSEKNHHKPFYLVISDVIKETAPSIKVPMVDRILRLFVWQAVERVDREIQSIIGEMIQDFLKKHTIESTKNCRFLNNDFHAVYTEFSKNYPIEISITRLDWMPLPDPDYPNLDSQLCIAEHPLPLGRSGNPMVYLLRKVNSDNTIVGELIEVSAIENEKFLPFYDANLPQQTLALQKRIQSHLSRLSLQTQFEVLKKMLLDTYPLRIGPMPGDPLSENETRSFMLQIKLEDLL